MVILPRGNTFEIGVFIAEVYPDGASWAQTRKLIANNVAKKMQ